MSYFEPFPKLARLNRHCVITEKIDGVNAQIFIDSTWDTPSDEATWVGREQGGAWIAIYAGSRNQWCTPAKDLHGFAKWVKEHGEVLFKTLGFGRHFGEWWGSGIQRGYGLPKGEKRFSLFNTGRWNAENLQGSPLRTVPILFEGKFSTEEVNYQVKKLAHDGSVAAPGFKKGPSSKGPEGVVVYHSAANLCFKVTVEKDEMSKQEAEHLAKLAQS